MNQDTRHKPGLGLAAVVIGLVADVSSGGGFWRAPGPWPSPVNVGFGNCGIGCGRNKSLALSRQTRPETEMEERRWVISKEF